MNTDLSFRNVSRALRVSIIAVICAILCGGYYFYRYQKINLTEAKRNELSALADLKRSQIVDWRNERLNDGMIIQNNPLINHTIQSFLQSSADVRTKNDILMWLNVRKTTYRYLSAMLCDTSGTILLSTEQNDSISLNALCSVRNAVLSGSILFTDLHQNGGSSVIHLDIVIPIFDLRKNKKNVTAVVLLRVDPGTYLYPLLNSWPIPGNSFESFIFRRDGDSVLYLSELRHKKNTALRFRLPVAEEHLPSAVAIRTGERYYEGVDYRGIPVVTVIRTIPGTSWYLIVKMDADELYAPLQRELQIAIFFSLLLIISFVSTVGFILRSQRAEYYQAQYHSELQRKQAEESLRETNEYLQNLIDYTNTPIVVWDRSFCISRFNHAFEQLSGYTAGEVLGKHIELLFSRENINTLSNLIKKTSDGERWETVEIVIQRKDREVRTVLWNSANIYDPEGKDIVATIAQGQDITERNRVLDELRESEDKFKYIFEYSPLGKSFTLPTGEINVNKAFCEMLGYTKEEMHSQKWMDITHPEDIELTQKTINSLLSGEKQTTQFIKRYLHKNGSIVWTDVNTSLRRDNNGKPLYFMTSASNITARIKMEKAIHESEYRMHRLSESGLIGIIYWNMNGQIMDANDKFLEMTRYTRDDLITGNIDWGNITPPEFRHLDEISVKELKAIGYNKKPFEKEYVCKDGARLPVIIGGAMLDEERFNGIAIVIDISERKQFEDKLKESNALLRLAEKKAKLGGWNVNIEENLCYWSEEVAAIHEMPVGFVPQVEDGINFYAPEWREKITRVFTDCAEKGIPYNEEMEIITSTGKRVWVQTIGEAVKNDKGKIVKVHGSFQDINIRKNNEEKIRLHSLRLKNMIQIDKSILRALESPEAIVHTAIKQLRSLLQCQRVSVGIFNLEKKEMMIYAAVVENETVVQTGKVLPESIYGDIDILRKNKMEIIEDESKVPSPSSVNMMLQAEGLQSFINVALVSDLEMYGVMNIGWKEPKIITVNERDIAGEVASQITIAIEKARLLKETKRYAAELEERVIQRTAQLEDANKELEAFSYSVSHDLRAPLRHVGGYVNLLSKYFPDALPEQGKHYLSSITDSVRQMGTLIDDLLHFSRTSRSEMKMVNVDMREMVADIVQSYVQEFPKRTIQWIIGPLPAIVCDSPMMKLVWTNLLSNAVKFTKPREKARIEIGIADNTAEYIFSVRDNGVGFDMQYADKLFGVFQRLHSKSEFEGTGIGLANVHRIVLRHGGRIWAEAELNNGATFSFTIPKRKDDQL